MSKRVYGIDLGTTYSAIATLDEYQMPKIIENEVDATPTLASAVYFPGGSEPIVGIEAKNHAEIDPNNVVQFVKRQIGKEDAKIWEFDGVKYGPIEISTEILKQMKRYVKDQTGDDVVDVVITCPAYFKTNERNATKRAGEDAGLNVLNIVNEPTAAALSYCSREYQEDRKILVYDLGGGTFDVTLLDFSVDESGNASIQVLATDGDDQLGGIDWDNLLFNYIANEYSVEVGIEIDDFEPLLRQHIRSQIEGIKQSLSKMPNKNVMISNSGDITSINVTRDAFEELTKSKVEETMDFVHRVLEDTKTEPDDVNIVLLVGGSSNMPMIKSAVESLFPGKVRLEEPNKAIAKGAALSAAIEWNEKMLERIEDLKSGKILSTQDDELPQTEEDIKAQMINVPRHLTSDKPVVKDILSCSFGPGVIVNGEFMINNLLFDGDSTPATASETYYTPEEDLEFIEIPIFDNISKEEFVTPCEDGDGNEQDTDPDLKVRRIDKKSNLKLPLPPNTPKGSPIETTFYYDTNGLTVTVKNPNTGEEEQVNLDV